VETKFSEVNVDIVMMYH